MNAGDQTAASFRDPAGCVLSIEGRIFRIVNPAGEADLDAFLHSPAAQEWVRKGRIVSTRTPDRAEAPPALQAAAGQTLLEHERIPFPSFPYEWIPEMLHAAAGLTLDLAQSLLADGIGLKDATPYNILFRGPEPVFIDILSFERRDPADPTWLPYAQFVRTFLLPLLAVRHFGAGLDQILTTRRDGLEPEEVYRWCGPLLRLKPPFLSLVAMPAWLGGARRDDASIYQRKLLDDPAKARFILEHLWAGLRRALAKAAPKAGAVSAWSDYAVSNHNYSADHKQAKESFVAAALEEFRPARVLDVGCNTGTFSLLAARNGASVVAIDYDPVVLGNVWRRAREANLDVLPLAVNLARPTPSTGWRNRECPSFLDRARGSFDAVLMLAVIHHMLVTERIPLPDILAMASELTTSLAIVEFVGPEDSMFRRLTRGREQLHRDLTCELFEELCLPHFEILRVQHFEGTARWLYVLRKRSR